MVTATAARHLLLFTPLASHVITTIVLSRRMTAAARFTPPLLLVLVSRESSMLSFTARLGGSAATKTFLQDALALTAKLLVTTCQNIFDLHL